MDAVKSEILIAVSVYVLVAFVKKTPEPVGESQEILQSRA
jgi:hypothetical protein